MEDIKKGLLEITKSLKDKEYDNAIDKLEELTKTVETTDEVETTEEGDETVEKTVEAESLTEKEVQDIKKFIDLYVSNEDVIKLLKALEGKDIEELFKTVKDHQTFVEEMKKTESKQITKTVEEKPAGIWDSLPF